MKTFNPATNSWLGIPNTNVAGIKATEGYMTFIRGDRTANTVNSVTTQTVVRTKGNLYTGDQAPVIVDSGKFGSIGNPYASAVDMRSITKQGLKDFFYVWDPNLGGNNSLGGYQTFYNDGGNYVVTPGLGSYAPAGGVCNYIQSGQAFLIQATWTLVASHLKKKPKGRPWRNFYLCKRVPTTIAYQLVWGKSDGSAYLLDGILTNYGDNYSNSVDDMDAIKPLNQARSFP